MLAFALDLFWAWSWVPQFRQNLAPSGLGVWQLGQSKFNPSFGWREITGSLLKRCAEERFYTTRVERLLDLQGTLANVGVLIG